MASKAVEELQRIKQREEEIQMFREDVREAWQQATRPPLDQRKAMSVGWKQGWPDLATIEALDARTVELSITALEGGRATVPCAVNFLRDAPELAIAEVQASLDETFQAHGMTQSERQWR